MPNCNYGRVGLGLLKVTHVQLMSVLILTFNFYVHNQYQYETHQRNVTILLKWISSNRHVLATT